MVFWGITKTHWQCLELKLLLMLQVSICRRKHSLSLHTFLFQKPQNNLFTFSKIIKPCINKLSVNQNWVWNYEWIWRGVYSNPIRNSASNDLVDEQYNPSSETTVPNIRSAAKANENFPSFLFIALLIM